MSGIMISNAPELGALEPSRAEQIRKVFEPMADAVARMEEMVEPILTEYQQTGDPTVKLVNELLAKVINFIIEKGAL